MNEINGRLFVVIENNTENILEQKKEFFCE